MDEANDRALVSIIQGCYAAIIGALAPGGFVIGLGEFEIMGLMPNVASDFKVSEQSIGQLIGPYALGVVIGAPMLAILGGRLQRKTLLIGLMALYALANLLSALAPTFNIANALGPWRVGWWSRPDWDGIQPAWRTQPWLRSQSGLVPVAAGVQGTSR